MNRFYNNQHDSLFNAENDPEEKLKFPDLMQRIYSVLNKNAHFMPFHELGMPKPESLNELQIIAYAHKK